MESGQLRAEQLDGEFDSGNVAGVGTSWTDLMSPEDAAKYNKWVD